MPLGEELENLWNYPFYASLTMTEGQQPSYSQWAGHQSHKHPTRAGIIVWPAPAHAYQQPLKHDQTFIPQPRNVSNIQSYRDLGHIYMR